MSKKQSKKSPDLEQSKVETPKEKHPKKKAAPSESPKPEPPLTLESLKQQLDDLTQYVQHHAERILYYDTIIKRRHKMTSNGSVQILDKVAGKVYPSKNSAYQTLLKAGELQELVEQGIFGAEPEKNTFGWYALVRAWPDRFEEKKTEDQAAAEDAAASK